LGDSPPVCITSALGTLAFVTMLNVRGLGVGKWLSNPGAWARFLATLLLVVLGAIAWWRFGPATPITAAALRPGLGLNDLIFWGALAFAFAGPDSASLMGGGITNPRRTVPQAPALAAPLIVPISVTATLALLVS